MPQLRSALVAGVFLCALATPAVSAVGIRGLRVLSTDAGSVTFEYRLPEYRLEDVDTPDGPRRRILVEGLGATSEPGQPELPLGAVAGTSP